MKSVVNLLESFGVPFVLTDSAEKIEQADKLLFPGQGHFGQVMESLNRKGLVAPLKAVIEKGVPFFGICVGLQVLFDSSEEAPNARGLGIFKGTGVRFQTGKVPQIGWNKIQTTAANTFLSDDFYYFVNSYHVVPADSSIVSAVADYHVPFTAAVQYKNIAATQFHPEKSGQVGRDTLKRWVFA